MSRLGVALALGVLMLGQPFSAAGDERNEDFDHVTIDNARQLVDQGRQTFRFDTFGDEDFWGGELHLHEALDAKLPARPLLLDVITAKGL